MHLSLPSEKRGNGRRYGDPLYEKFGDTWQLIGYEDIALASEVIHTSNPEEF